MLTISVTGHRPPKLGGYASSVFNRLTDFAQSQLQLLSPDEVITGMALGWDQAVATACVRLDIPYTAAIPFEGQESVWPASSQQIYKTLVEAATNIVIVSEGKFSAAKMQIRNQWMVDNSDQLVALWDGSSGGTYNCIKYCRDNVKKPWTNIWDKWKEYA